MKRKRYVGREAIKFWTGEPLKYGSNWKLPRPQERVPRSVQRPIMTARKAGMTLREHLIRTGQFDKWLTLKERFSAKRVLQLNVRPARVRRVVPPTRNVLRRFVFRSPFSAQYQFLKAAGRMVRHPEKVAFCLKRKIRREVLFAFRRAGFRGSGPGRRRTYRRNGNSLHGC